MNKKTLIYVFSFVIAGVIDSFFNGKTFETLNFTDFQAFPISLLFVAYQFVFIIGGFLIIYSLRRKKTDLLTLPAWLVGFDAVSLIISGKSIVDQLNWRQQIWGNPIGFIGELWIFNVPIGYWISFVFLIVYFLILYKPRIGKKPLLK